MTVVHCPGCDTWGCEGATVRHTPEPVPPPAAGTPAARAAALAAVEAAVRAAREKRGTK